MKAKSIITFLVLCMVGSSAVSAQEITPNVVQNGRQWSFYRGLSQGERLRFTGENPVIPASETITLSTTGCEFQKVEILDANGRVLYAATLNDAATFDYNVSWMSSGIYLARVTTPCGVLTKKFSVR